MLLRILVLSILFASCSNRMIETSLYFGQSKPGGATISQAEWVQFRDQQIATIYKEGFSVIKLEGAWQDTATRELITEPTYKVICYYKRSPSLSAQIDSLRNRYIRQFQQQSVLRVDRKVRASFD